MTTTPVLPPTESGTSLPMTTVAQAHGLTPERLDALAVELDALRVEVAAQLGTEDDRSQDDGKHRRGAADECHHRTDGTGCKGCAVAHRAQLLVGKRYPGAAERAGMHNAGFCR